VELIRLEIVTPEKIAYDSQVRTVVLPGFDGELAVMGGHAPMVVALVPGVIYIYDANKDRVMNKFGITGGFCEIRDICMVLTEELYDVTSYQPDFVETEIARLKDIIAQGEPAYHIERMMKMYEAVREIPKRRIELF
jgi:F-type H+-transporting ATPase subunit epsilon